MFERQLQHGALLAILLAGVATVVVLSPGVLEGQWAGVATGTWLVVAVAVPVVHQVYVWLVWRAELYYSAVSRRCGQRTGFAMYAVGFLLLFAARLVSVIVLAVANRNTLPIEPIVGYVVAAALAVPWLYAVYSVLRYFGLRRAMGIDHFDRAYRERPFVKRGIFRFTSNGMYVFGFLALWLPGLVLFSQAALLAAAFNHLYIWVHYYATELPDIRRIYGRA